MIFCSCSIFYHFNSIYKYLRLTRGDRRTYLFAYIPFLQVISTVNSALQVTQVTDFTGPMQVSCSLYFSSFNFTARRRGLGSRNYVCLSYVTCALCDETKQPTADTISMWHQNIGRSFVLSQCTDVTDGRTDKIMNSKTTIPWLGHAVKIATSWNIHIGKCTVTSQCSSTELKNMSHTISLDSNISCLDNDLCDVPSGRTLRWYPYHYTSQTQSRRLSHSW